MEYGIQVEKSMSKPPKVYPPACRRPQSTSIVTPVKEPPVPVSHAKRNSIDISEPTKDHQRRDVPAMHNLAGRERTSKKVTIGVS